LPALTDQGAWNMEMKSTPGYSDTVGTFSVGSATKVVETVRESTNNPISVSVNTRDEDLVSKKRKREDSGDDTNLSTPSHRLPGDCSTDNLSISEPLSTAIHPHSDSNQSSKKSVEFVDFKGYLETLEKDKKSRRYTYGSITCIRIYVEKYLFAMKVEAVVVLFEIADEPSSSSSSSSTSTSVKLRIQDLVDMTALIDRLKMDIDEVLSNASAIKLFSSLRKLQDNTEKNIPKEFLEGILCYLKRSKNEIYEKETISEGFDHLKMFPFSSTLLKIFLMLGEKVEQIIDKPSHFTADEYAKVRIWY
jgi:hypothetical protein